MSQKEEEYTWLVNFVKDRHHHLDLSFEQAEKLKEYENKEQNLEFTSVWDEIERHHVFMLDLLDDKQYKLFLPDYEQRKKSAQESIELNIEMSILEINYSTDLLEYAVAEYCPKMVAHRMSFDKVLSVKDRAIVDAAIGEYKLAIIESRKISTVKLKRLFKNFNPKAFEESKLQYDLHELIPTPVIFYSEESYQNTLSTITAILTKYADELNFWLEKTNKIEDPYLNKVNDLLDEHYAFDQEPQGWHIEIKIDEAEADFRRKFSFLMMKNIPNQV